MKMWIRFSTASLLLGVLLLGCSRDPNVAKQKYMQSGMQFFQANKYREAALQFQSAIQIDPRFAEAHYQLARCYMRESLLNGAYEELLRTVDLRPQDTAAMTDLAQLLLAGRKFQDAHDRAAAVLALKPDSYDAELLLASSDAGLGNAKAAGDDIQKAKEMAPTRPEAYVYAGRLELQNQKLGAAEASFRKAVSADPNFLPARLVLAEFYQQQNP